MLSKEELEVVRGILCDPVRRGLLDHIDEQQKQIESLEQERWRLREMSAEDSRRIATKDALLREALLYLCKLFEIRDYGIGLLTPGGMKFQSLIERINSEFAQNESPTQPEDVKRISSDSSRRQQTEGPCDSGMAANSVEKKAALCANCGATKEAHPAMGAGGMCTKFQGSEK